MNYVFYSLIYFYSVREQILWDNSKPGHICHRSWIVLGFPPTIVSQSNGWRTASLRTILSFWMSHITAWTCPDNWFSVRKRSSLKRRTHGYSAVKNYLMKLQAKIVRAAAIVYHNKRSKKFLEKSPIIYYNVRTIIII